MVHFHLQTIATVTVTVALALIVILPASSSSSSSNLAPACTKRGKCAINPVYGAFLNRGTTAPITGSRAAASNRCPSPLPPTTSRRFPVLYMTTAKKKKKNTTLTSATTSTSASATTPTKKRQRRQPATSARSPSRPLPDTPAPQKTPRPSWTQRFDQLCDYRRLHGDCLVPLRCAAYPGLGVWVRNQRTHYRNVLSPPPPPPNGSPRPPPPCLTPARTEALKSIGFVWQASQRERLWRTQFRNLLRFRRVYGHCLVPERYHDDPALGNWVAHQRRTYRGFVAGEGSGLTEEKIRSLQGIGFCWTERDFRWYGMLERLRVYAEEGTGEERAGGEGGEGEERGGERFTVEYDDRANTDLRLWVSVQRKEYASFRHNLSVQRAAAATAGKKAGRPRIERYSAMTQRRIDALETIGFPWKSSRRIKDEGPTVDDWSQLFVKMREKGIDSRTKAKTHWFEGESVIRNEDGDSNGKARLYTEDELLELWNMGEDDDED